MKNLDKAIEKQTKEDVDRQFSEFMSVFKGGEDSVPAILSRAKNELDIWKIARLYGRLPRLNRWEREQTHIHIKCPFHDDNNPSCSVWRDINAFKCWSCGTSGDIITFIQLLSGTNKVPVGLIKRMLEKKKLHKRRKS